jgi:hypothetical protein
LLLRRTVGEPDDSVRKGSAVDRAQAKCARAGRYRAGVPDDDIGFPAGSDDEKECARG